MAQKHLTSLYFMSFLLPCLGANLEIGRSQALLILSAEFQTCFIDSLSIFKHLLQGTRNLHLFFPDLKRTELFVETLMLAMLALIFRCKKRLAGLPLVSSRTSMGFHKGWITSAVSSLTELLTKWQIEGSQADSSAVSAPFLCRTSPHRSYRRATATRARWA